MHQTKELGLSILQKVLGAEYFAKRQASQNAFNVEMRGLVEEYCFGTIWGRPGLDARTRSMLVLAMLTALGKGAELKMHVLGAINNGCTVDEIKEVLLQATIYCGVPSGVEAFRAAEEVLNQLNLIPKA
ncbi:MULTISPECIES: carboxymuconolactone decarboxylase family protein [unclassified Variovorax]|uniref:carboxymuconolactone decarboxylase family protein n=1 Tax=unclassified Variovorax TaxID=663243 RepID=UPI000837D649|nr:MULTISPECIES: carboxymuconolactone decarboxylase family protein [unclassified Variovorax]PNG48785.1 hypothetical protein CHC06_06526 [Variovorax sp. B2]PNG49292.1 hypothetical protein CHC07_06174 [Variovorax sp. B4]VTV18434.1 4-carboxymuconolactone decarboxylase [Variovorax sp. WDL1]